MTNVSELPDRVAEFQLELARERIPLQLRVGGELAHGMVDRLSQYELELIAQGPPGARWILLEAPFPGFGPAFHDAADELRERGFGVVIGHPERSARLGEDLASLRHEVLYGSVLQLNVWTIAGRHGEEARDIALRLVREGLAGAGRVRRSRRLAQAADRPGRHRPAARGRGPHVRARADRYWAAAASRGGSAGTSSRDGSGGVGASSTCGCSPCGSKR